MKKYLEFIKKILEFIFGFKIVRKIFGFIILIIIIKGYLEYESVQKRKETQQAKIDKKERIEEEKKRYNALPLSEKIKSQAEMMHYGDFIKYENDILYLNRLLYCKDANAGGKKFGTAAGAIWLCEEDCAGLMHDIYYLSNQFPQIKYVDYSFKAKSKDDYGYTTIQQRGSFRVNIQKEKFKLYRTANDLKIHSRTMNACRDSQDKEIGSWKRTGN